MPRAWHPLARKELFEASGFYEEHSPGLGVAFLDTVSETIEQLRNHPRLGREIPQGARRFSVSGFPYSLIYRLNPDEKLFILAVAHQKRHPEYWVGR